MDAKDRRSFARRRHASVVKFTAENKSTDKSFHGITGNVCDTGFSFFTVCTLEEGDVLKLEGLKTPECLGGKVRWVKRTNGIIQAGVECSKLMAV